MNGPQHPAARHTPRQAQGDAPAQRGFVLKLGRALHSHGYPSHLLEDALEVVSRRLGLEAQFFSTPTALFASFGSADEQRTFQLRIPPGDVSLAALARLERLTAEVAEGRLTPAEGAVRIEEIVAEESPYGAWLTTLCFGLASAAAARFFGGGAADVAGSGAVGLALGALAAAASRLPPMARVFEPLAALVVSFLAAAGAVLVPGLSPDVVTLAGLIILIPGLGLTVAMTELAHRHLMSGTGRLAGTGGTFLAIGFGAALGARLGERLFGAALRSAPETLPGWTLALALVVAPLAFVVLLRAEATEAPAILGAGLVAFAGARAGAHLVGPELGAFFGALAVGVASNLYSRVRGAPAAVTLVPGILLLVPGSLGFRSLSSLLEQQTLVGVDTAFKMTLVAVSLSSGLVFASALVPSRRLSRPGPG